MDFFDADGWASGRALEAALHAQREGPLRWVAARGVLAVLGHGVAVEVLSAPARFGSAGGTGLVAGGPTGRSLNLADGPPSRELRQLVQAVLEAKEPEQAPWLERIASEAVERARRRRRADGLTDLGEVVARAVFGRRFGLEAAEVDALARLTEGLARSGHDGDAQQAADEGLRALLRRGLRERRNGAFWALGDQALSLGLPPEDAMFLLRLVVQTGHESTAQAIAGAIHAALEWDLPFDGSARASEEWLRWTSPLIRFARVAAHDTVVAGVDVPRGTRLAVLFPVVNRDPAVFREPLVPRLDRSPNPHLAFGAGPHACAGARLARGSLGAVMRALAAVPRPALAGPVTRLVSSVTRGYQRLPLSFGQ